MSYQRVFLTTDNDGHNYVVPYDLKDQFLELLESSEDCPTDEDAFECLFGHYRTGGDYNLKELYIKF